MRVTTIFKLAYRNLWLHRLRSTLTVGGMTLGIAAIIFLVSLGYGLEGLVTSQVANFKAFTVIDVPATTLKALRIDDSAIEKIKAFSHVDSVASAASLPGRIKKVEQSSSAETVVQAASSDYWDMADTFIDEGRLPGTKDEIVVNQSLISLLGETKETVLGKKVSLEMIVPAELQKEATASKVTEPKELTVVGYIADEGGAQAYINTDLLKAAGAVNYTTLKVRSDSNDPRLIEGVRKQIENLGLATEYVGDTVNEIGQVFSLFRLFLATFGLIALIVAALGAFNTLTISLLERTREVGLMKALGMRNNEIYKLFVAESLIIGIMGGVMGLGLGFAAGDGVNALIKLLAERSGVEPITIFVTPVSFAVMVAVFSIFVGFVTGWYPSKRATRINPLDALRYE